MCRIGIFLDYKALLPDTWRKRAEHYYEENRRVKEGIKAWKMAISKSLDS